MSPLLSLLLILLAAAVLVGLAIWAERVTRHRGLTMLVAGVSAAASGFAGLFRGPTLLAVLFLLQAVAFLVIYAGHRRDAKRTDPAAEA
ncbi:MAG: hypothetical protein JNL44_17100 [Gemmatimonadetes bacterium]|nr:hypothetical protein [Gemmatimonadota bacterium]